MSNITLNTPTCHPCDGDTPRSAGIAPYYAVDTGKVTLTAGVTATVTFVNIKNITSPDQWVMPKSTCLNAFGSEIPATIVKSATGFTVTAEEDGTLEYFCIKI